MGMSFTSRYQGWIHTDRILQCSVALYKYSSDTRGNVTFFTATPCAAPSSPGFLKHKAEGKISVRLGHSHSWFPQQGYMSRGTLGSPVQPLFKLHLEFTALFSPPFAVNKIFPPPPCNRVRLESRRIFRFSCNRVKALQLFLCSGAWGSIPV